MPGVWVVAEPYGSMQYINSKKRTINDGASETALLLPKRQIKVDLYRARCASSSFVF